MTTFGRIRRMLTVLVAGGAVAGGVFAGGAPAQAAVTPFTLSLTAMHSGLVLAESSNLPGAAVVQTDSDSELAAAARKWRFDLIAASTARLVNEEFPGLCMEPEKPNEASIVRMKACSGSTAQVWKDHARQFNGQTVHQWSNLNSHMCLDVSGASLAPNALVIQFPCKDGAANQLFKHTIV